MPELPDTASYLVALRPRIIGQVLENIVVRSPFLVRTVEPDLFLAFRKEMAVHGRFRKPCLVCGTLIQRIVHAANETNFCPRCLSGGKLLAGRSLARLLKSDWPKTNDAWEEGAGLIGRGVVGIRY